jgi:hypothetical protein
VQKTLLAAITLALLTLTACSGLRLMHCPEHVEGAYYKCEKP